jgi:hypothetical protein
MCGGKKIKNIWSAMSVGLLVVRLLYRFYVFGHLSKWFVFALLFNFLVGLSSCERSFYHWL